MPETSYIVLRRTRDAVTRDNAAPSHVPEQWEHVAKVNALSAESAIRKAAIQATAPGAADPALVLVAVPARSWKPVTVKAEQTTTLTLQPATASTPAEPT